jgi:hypothetical protein
MKRAAALETRDTTNPGRRVKRLRKIHELNLALLDALIEGCVFKAEGATFAFLISTPLVSTFTCAKPAASSVSWYADISSFCSLLIAPPQRWRIHRHHQFSMLSYVRQERCAPRCLRTNDAIMNSSRGGRKAGSLPGTFFSALSLLCPTAKAAASLKIPRASGAVVRASDSAVHAGD